MKCRFLLVGAVAVCLGCSSFSGSETPPNIVLIISDDHEWPNYGFMGHPALNTPALDRLASESMVYTQGYLQAPVCRPSLATIATGLYPHKHGITGNDPRGEWRAAMEAVFDRNENVAELLGRSGYISHQFGTWWEGNPLDHGFTAMTHGGLARGGRHGGEDLAIGRESMERIFEFIEGAGENPFFV